MRDIITPGEYYHIYNRGMKKQRVFLDPLDYARFLCMILYCQSITTINNITYSSAGFIKHSMFNIKPGTVQKILDNRTVELVAFILLPNHFHLLVKGVGENGSGISTYMQRILNGYTKYFNAKYEQNGHLFQGRFQRVHIADNNQLLYISAYIHKNCREFPKWRDREQLYRWSSYQDYVRENRWGKLLQPEIILDQFKDRREYQSWVKNSSAKDIPYETFNV